jgi:hypothetical protein
MDKFKKWNLPGGVQKLVRRRGQAEDGREPGAGQGQDVRGRDRAQSRSRQGRRRFADQGEGGARRRDTKQQAKVAESRTKITNKQAETLGKQEAEGKKLDKQSGEKKKSTLAKVNDRVAKDQAKVETDYADAQKKADGEKTKGEEDVKKKKAEAEKKANAEKLLGQRRGRRVRRDPGDRRRDTHDIYTKIVNLGLTNDVIAKISSTALAEATSTAPANSYPK